VLVAPVGIEIDPVDISLQTLVILIIGGIFKPTESVAIVLSYIALGALGLPVYSGYVGGLDKLLGPTSGFFLGFLISAPMVGFLIPKVKWNFWIYSAVFVFGHSTSRCIYFKYSYSTLARAFYKELSCWWCCAWDEKTIR